MSRPTGAPRRASPPLLTARTTAEDGVREELEAWRHTAMPDATTPLDAEDLVQLLRDCIGALRLDAAIAAGVTVNTVHYYRRKDVIDPPVGKTAAARYELRHLWQVAGARLAGYLGLVTLAEARNVIRGADDATSLTFLAARVVDARAKDTVRGTTPAEHPAGAMRPLPRALRQTDAAAASTRATVVSLPGNAWCVVPAAHAAHHSPEAADALVRALAVALRGSRSS